MFSVRINVRKELTLKLNNIIKKEKEKVMGAQNNEKNILNEKDLAQVNGGLKTNLRDNAVNRLAMDNEGRPTRALRPMSNAAMNKNTKSPM